MRSKAHTYMLQHWPSARAMRFEGDCPKCKHAELYSCLFAGDPVLTFRNDIEICWYFCPDCWWASGGNRPATNIETADDPADVVYRKGENDAAL